jgi:hypothetical protein
MPCPAAVITATLPFKRPAMLTSPDRPDLPGP